MRKSVGAIVLSMFLAVGAGFSAEAEVLLSEQGTAQERISDKGFSASFYGYRPPTYRPLVQRKEEAMRRKQGVLPVRFDLREFSRVSPVKDQMQRNACWAFATMGALESRLLLSQGALHDFSEKHLLDHVGFENIEEGGHMHMAQAYLARAEGPVDEADDPYESSGVVTERLEPKVYLKSAYNIAEEEIKEALMNYGAVQTVIYADDENPEIFNAQHQAQHLNESMYKRLQMQLGEEEIVNHEVVIVGWDDRYPKERFSVKPEQDGAWIVRNSWGTDWGDRGYYYVSYEDRTIGQDNMVYAKVSESKGYDRRYEHDEYGRVIAYGYRDEPYHWFANVFTAESMHERINAVAFYTNEPDVEYEVYVDTDYDGTFDFRKVEVEGERMEYAGYHTVELLQEEPIIGEHFAVAVRLRTNEELPIAIELNEGSLERATSHPNESFISTDGENWEDTKYATYIQNGQEFVLDANVCLKAFTVGGEPSNEPAQEPDELREAKWWSEDELITSDAMKVWQVRFNQALNPQSIVGQVKVFDTVNYREIPIAEKLADDGRTVLVQPQEIYQQGKEYILYVGTVQSISGKELHPIRAKFRLE